MIFKANGKSQMAKLIFVLFFISIPYTLYPIPSLAQTASPSGTLLEKLNDLKNEIASKAAQIKNEVNKKVENKAVIGTIAKIDSDNLTVTTRISAKTVKFDEFTEFIGLKGKKITIKTLEVNDPVAALGDNDDKNNLAAKKIIFLESDSWRIATGSSTLIWGQIEKASPGVITVKNKKGKSIKLLVSFQTVFFLGNNEAASQDAKVEKFLVARTTALNDGSIRAKYIYFIPSIGFVKPEKKETTPSASVSKTGG